ncbi:MAG: hypothetical protein IJ141_11140 [Lachnospiraceae bacterium]|nr:hypothetical protein [Lachnospiraceae bacterium]
MANNQLKEEIILSTQHFDKKIDDVIKQVNRLKAQGNKIGGGFNSSMGQMIQRATGFNGSLGSIIASVGKLGGALGAFTSGVQLASWFKNAVEEGSKLAMEGEGIRLAFERLNKGDLLENLRKETHGTVTDLELMKQAVKFNDFNLNLDQMGSFLAFAQQKAKDTGQSIDYMVDSIVTGLGRKSLPILDNLGISATAIKEKMKDGGDMTTAVAEIIKEKMEAAGGYVETAADRAKKKEVELQNELEELGRTFQPLTETSSNFWHSIEIGALKAINSLRPLINEFTELGRIMNQYDLLGGNKNVDRMIGNLGNGKGQKALNTYNKQLKAFDKTINNIKFKIAALGNDKSAIGQGNKARLEERLAAAVKMRADYVKKANDLHNRQPQVAPTNTENNTNIKGGGRSKNTVEYAVQSVGWLENHIAELNKQIKLQVDPSEIKKLQDEIKETQRQLDNLLNPRTNTKADFNNISSNGFFGKPSALNPKDININTPSIAEQYQNAQDKIGDVLDLYDMGVIKSAKEAQEMIDKINASLEALGLKKVEVHIETDAEKVISNVSDVVGELGASFSSLGQSLELPELDVLGIIAQAIANVIAGYATASKQAAALGPWAWIGFSAAGLAQVAAVIAQIHSLSGYANGGIIGGNSYSGDNLLARVNSGEAIINQNQQKHLFELLNSGANSLGGSVANVNFVIKGKDLHGCLRNYNSKMDKVI